MRIDGPLRRQPGGVFVAGAGDVYVARSPRTRSSSPASSEGGLDAQAVYSD